jgi:hypothetical protein
MSETKHKYVSKYTEEMLMIPKVHMSLELLQDSDGLKVTPNNQNLISTDSSNRNESGD